MIKESVRMRREILVRLAKAFMGGNLIEKIDRIPLEMRPKDESNTSRCCVYRDRSLLKYRIMASLGVPIEEEIDELKTLSEYADEQLLLGKGLNQNKLTILSEACTACKAKHHVVTNACQGCMAQGCISSCPRNAITKQNDFAVIDTSKCINCSKCVAACPYNAIVCMEPPCQQQCPVDAIHKEKNAKASIDFSKCIYCGKCIDSCPFSAVMDCSEMLFVLDKIKSDSHVTALVAPSLMSQFSASIEKTLSALLQTGFDEVIEVAQGAEKTLVHEANEFAHRAQAEDFKFMTSSCCASYIEYASKHMPELLPMISDTPSPMHYSAKHAKQKNPNTTTVFITPCVAKRVEASKDENVDYVLTIEELVSLWVAKGINAESQQPASADKLQDTARKFASAGTVASGLSNASTVPVKSALIDGITSKTKFEIKQRLAGKFDDNFIEVMSCKGGCVGGIFTLTSSKRANKYLANHLENLNESE